MDIAKETIAEIRSKANIVDIIRHYIPVQKKGNAYVAVCPFHNDHDPSLKISNEKQIYHCFVCQAGGSVFQFVQDFEKISFRLAVLKVADIVGFKININIPSEQTDNTVNKRLKELLTDTTQYFTYSLKTDAALKAQMYLKKRGIDEETIAKFNIGFNLPNQLYRYLKAKGYQEQEMIEANVVRYFNGTFQDVFQNRICFAIHDRKGQTIAYTARSLDKDIDSKYINTDNNALFQKGRTIYNFHRAKLAARRLGKVILCEGVMDVIAFSQVGIDNAVCTLGTACTIEQVRILANMAPLLVIAYDGDQAGQNASYKVAKLAQKIGLEVRILKNYDQLDPDEILRQKGKDALQSFGQREQNYVEFLLNYKLQQVNLDNYSERKKAGLELASELESINDQIDRQYLQKKIEEKLGFSLPNAKLILSSSKVNKTKDKVVDGLEIAELEILTYMAKYPCAITYFDQQLGYLLNATYNEIALTLVNHQHCHQEISLLELLENSQNMEERKCWTNIIARENQIGEYQEEILRALFNRIQIANLEEKMLTIYQSLENPCLDKTSRKIMLDKYSAIKRELGKLKISVNKE